ncbi:MAG: beta strand repeat-containing protein [Ilumatobacteraceae bacterium]
MPIKSAFARVCTKGLSVKLLSAFVVISAAIGMTTFDSAVLQAATVSRTFSYTNTIDTSFVVPANTYSISVAMYGGQGGLGGGDSQGSPTPGGYRGVVTGTIPVTPGDVVTVAVGGGGGTGVSSRGSAAGGSAGVNPLDGYDGATGGVAGPAGSSGGGGGGGAATVVKVGSLSFVAAGAGGNGGNGQYLPIVGRRASETHSPRADAPTSTSGRVGKDTSLACTAGFRCDGGASGAGGGGAVGGEQGEVQYGGATATEYFGFGGYPGSNSTAGVGSLTSYYEYYEGNSANGSVVITYDSGSPSAPTDVAGGQLNSSVSLTWKAPLANGGANITDYVIQYATSAGGAFTTFNDGVSTQLSTTVTGLTNGTPYFFRVAAVNSYGTSAYSNAMGAGVAPSDVPSAPSISSLTPTDGGLSVAFSAAASGAPILWYDYQIDGGDWVASPATASPVAISGLTNGSSYSIKIRGVSSIGDGAASGASSGTPRTVPAAPSISAIGLDTGAVSVSFDAGATGGSPITNYQYSINNGSTWTTRSPVSTASPLSISGLTGGVEYPIRLRAVNAAGSGTQSNVSNVTVKGAPGAPSISAIVAGDKRLSVYIDQGPNGGSSISMYQYSTDDGVTWRNRTDGGTTGSPMLITALVSDGTTSLTNGTQYDVRVRAENVAGYGVTSARSSSTPRTVPSAPSIVGSTVSGSNGVLNAVFTTPASTGGAVISTYQYSTDAGATWRTRTDGGTTASPVVISTLSTNGTSPLIGGTEYFVELRAVNSAGSGSASDVATGITKTAPLAPTFAALVGNDSSAAISFDVPANGGSKITKYEYKVDNGSFTDTGTLANTFTISGLTNGTTYSVVVRAVNDIGNGATSTSSSVTPSGSAPAPTLNSMTAGNKTLTVAFTAPTSNGGTAITSYQYSTDGGATWRNRLAGTTASPLVITTVSSLGNTDLVNGQTYTVQIRAINTSGAGSASTSLLSVPRAAPDSSTLGAVTVGDGRLTIAFVPGSTNGSAVLKYQYQLNAGAWVDAGSLNSPLTISGLTNGTSYSVSIRGVNDVGDGATSNAVTATPASPPTEPRTVIATGSNASAVISWLAPSDNGGAIVTGYTATAYNAAVSGSVVSSCSTALTTCTITGLVNGTTYYVSIVAINASGTGGESMPRAAVTPVTLPSAPTVTSITAGSTNLRVAFTAASSGGSNILDYEYAVNGGAWASSGRTASPLLLSGLTNGTSYSVKIRAITAVGSSSESNAISEIPYGLPSAVAGITAAPGTTSVVVSWSPTNNNGNAITTYTAIAWNSASEGGIVQSCTSSGTQCTVTGLSASTQYYFTVDATNAAGVGLRNTPRITATTGSTPPSAPTINSVLAGDAKVTVAWTAGSAGTSAITDYVVQYSINSGTSWTTFIDPVSTATQMEVTGLNNYVAHTFRVVAVSAVGAGSYSTASQAATPVGVRPDAPTIASVSAGDGQVTVVWTAGNANTDPISDYVVQYSLNGGDYTTFTSAASTSRSRIVSGLRNGSKYKFKVAAVSLAGQSNFSAISDEVIPLAPIVTTTTSTTTTTTSTTSTTVVTTTTVAISESAVKVVPSATTIAPVAVAAPTQENIGQDSVATIPKSGVTNTPEPMVKAVPTTTTTTTIPRPPVLPTPAPGAQPAAAPDAPSTALGEASVLVDGEPVAATLTRNNNQLYIKSAGVEATLGGVNENGEAIPLDSDGNLRLQQNAQLVLNSIGFTPGSEVGIWLFSTPTQLAHIVAEANGSISGTVIIPTLIKDGVHRVVIDGVTKDGKPIVLSVAIPVGKLKVSGPVTRILIGIPVLLAVFAGLLVPARRRRMKLRAIGS